MLLQFQGSYNFQISLQLLPCYVLHRSPNHHALHENLIIFSREKGFPFKHVLDFNRGFLVTWEAVSSSEAMTGLTLTPTKQNLLISDKQIKKKKEKYTHIHKSPVLLSPSCSSVGKEQFACKRV